MQFSLAKHQPGDGERTEQRTVEALQHQWEINLILFASVGGKLTLIGGDRSFAATGPRNL